MKEALNTFSEGLVKDYNEMVVPNKVMTNCLNGTLITYNGNEFTLQNDMGNAKLENVKLPAGYVPVGTAEYGGIVYIASYNPITKKGQIGSYPSPRQLWDEQVDYNGTEVGEESVTITPTDFLENGYTTTPIIKNEIVKKYLFRINGNSRHFSVGDQWNVFTKSFPTWLTQLLNDGYAKIEFSVINDSGHTETIDKLSYTDIQSNEDTYEAREGIQIIPSENSSENPKPKWQVLNTQSNGILQMTLRLNTYQTFVLNRRYNLDSNGNIESVTFTGTADNEDVELYYQGVGKSITIQPENGLVKYNIMPVHPAGVVKRLTRSGTIDIAKLQEQKSSFYNFHFYVGEYNTTIYWSYDYIDVNNDPITKMEVSYKQLKTQGESKTTTITLQEDSYIGDFQLVLGSLKLGGIYEIAFNIFKQGVEKPKTITKYLYNVPLFNNWSAQDFEDCKERPIISITPTYTTKTKVTQASVTIKRNSGWTPNAELVEIDPQQSDYIVRKPQIEHDFLTVKEGSYTIEPSIDLQVQEIEFEDQIYKTTQLGAEFTNLTYSIQNNVEIAETPTYSSLINNDKLKEDSSTEIKGNTIKVTTHRSVYAPQSTPYEKTLYTESLMPVYDQDHDKLFSFKESDGTLSDIAAGRIRVMHHSAVVRYGQTTNVSDGINTNINGDEEGLQAAMSAMGDQSFGIMAGYGGRKASLRIGNYQRPYGVEHNDSFSSDSSHVWWNNKSETEIDENDNFLIATCKDTNGQHFLLNLATRKNESIHGRKELPYYLRAILSQLLIAKRIKVTEPITAPDQSKVTYHTDYNTDVRINYSVDSNFTMTTGDGDNYNEILKELGDKALYIPNYVISTNNILEETITVGKELGIEDSPNLLAYYSISLPSVTISQESYKTQVEKMNKEPENYKYSSNDTIDANHLRSYIFIGEVKSIDVNTGVCELATYNDGSYVVKGIAGTELGDIWSQNTIKLTYWNSFETTTQLTEIMAGNLNKLFTTSLKFEGKQGSNIGESYYNTLLLNAVSGSSNGRVVCKWVEDSPDVNAPDMIMGYFGLLSPFKYNQ